MDLLHCEKEEIAPLVDSTSQKGPEQSVTSGGYHAWDGKPLVNDMLEPCEVEVKSHGGSVGKVSQLLI